MKKILIAALFLTNLVVFSACSRDRCPAHGQAPDVEQVKHA